MKRLPGSPRFPGLPALLALFLLASCNWQRPQPGFTLALNPTSLTVQQGASGQTTLTVTPQNGFTGTVALSLVAGQDQVPQGLTLSPGSVQVSGSGPVNRPLTLSAQPTAPTGTYRLKVRATSGSLTREADLTVAVTAPPPPPGFTLALNPTSLTVQQGASGQTTLTVTPQNGFTGTVALSLVAGQDQVPQGLTLSPGSVQVSGSGPVNQPLTLSAQPTAPTGTYRLRVRATSGSLTREADLTVAVTAPPPPPGFTLALNPTSLTVQQGASGQTTLTVTPQNGFTGTVALSLVAGQDQVPQGLTLSPGSVQVSGSGPVNQPLTLSAQPTTPTGTYRLKVRAASGSLTREADLTVTVSASGDGGGGGAGEVSLPLPVSGQGFPQPPLEVGLPEQGASLLAQDRLERVLITPQTMTLTPGEERFLSVWVETESGQRYAGDERYLELKWAGPQGYQVAWAGPGRVRVRAPAAFSEETLFVSVYRRDLLQADGKAFLSSVATVAMVEPRPEVVVIPEELVGLPVAYDLDQATVLARLALFPLEDLGRALDLDGSDGVITYPALVRIDEGRGITAERLRGQLIVGEGEASVLMGRVREVVARRLDVLLLAVEPALPWEVYARYQEEVDLGALARQGVIPLDPGRAFGDGDQAVTPQGLRPQSASQDRRCQWSAPKVEANLSGDLANLPNLWLRAGVKLEGKCKYADGKVVLSPSLTLTLGAGRFVFSPERFAAESAVGLGGEVKLTFKGKVDPQEMGLGYTWLFNGAIPLFLGGAFEVYLEYGIPAFSALRLMGDVRELGTRPGEVDLLVFGARANGSLSLRYDTSQSPALSTISSGGFQVFLETPFQQLAFGSATQSLNLTLNGDLFALGPTVGVGGTALKALKPLLDLVGILTGRDIQLGKDSVIALAIHVHPLSTELKYRYVFLEGALGGGGEPGSLKSSAALKVKVAVRSPILQYLAQKIQLIASILRGVDLTVLRYTRLEGDHRVLPGRLEVLPGGGQVRLRGEYLVGGAAEAEEVRAYRLRDRSLLATATFQGSNRQFELQVPVPGNCEVLPQEDRTAVVVLHARLAGIPVPLGWIHLGQVDLCSPIALEVPALRAFVGETAQGQGTARNGGGREVTLGLAAGVVGVSPASLSLPAGGSAPFSVSYRCTQEGSFVGALAAQVEGRTVARVPAVVTCIPDDDNDLGNNPPSERSLDRVIRFWGDPHLITPDGAAYDFHATGEFWAVEHPAMPLQLRFLPMPENPQATYTARLAARLGQARVEVRPLRPGEWWREGDFLPEVALAVLVEGEDRTEDLVRRGYLELPGDGYVAVSRWANVLVNNVLRERRPLEVVLVYPGANPRPAVAVRAERIGRVHALAVGAVRPQGLAGALRGLMGNANGDPSDDFTTRDGVRLTPPLAFGTLYGTFGRSWEVRPTERLFTDPAPLTRYPEAPPALDPERLREAEAFCAGIPDPYLRQACILDGAVTGDYRGAARAAQAVAEAREGTSGGTTPATRATSLGLAPDTLRLTASGAGDLTVANRGDQGVTYRLRLVGEGPGLEVDGAELRPEGETAAFTLAPGATRTHRVAALACQGEDQAYLLQGVEEGAAEAPAALVLVACQQGFDLEVDPRELSVRQGRQGAFSAILTPYGGFRGRVDFTLEGAPPGVELDPATASVEITGDAQVRHRLRARVGERVPPGTYSLTVRAISGSLTQTANLSLTVTASGGGGGGGGAGTTWTVRNLGNPLYGVAYGDGLFVAVGDRGAILTSPDGVTWTPRTSGTDDSLYGVTYRDGLFVAVGVGGTILTSPDGATWTRRTSGTRNWLTGVTYGNGTFVAVGFGGIILTSPDGVTWTVQASATSNGLLGVTYGNGTFVAVGFGGIILTSPDGVTWTVQASGMGNSLYGVTNRDGLFVAVGDRGTILTSPDGVTWTVQASGMGNSLYGLYGVTYENGTFVAVGERGTILTSPDGVTWTRRTSATSNGLLGVTYGNGTFVAVGGRGTILTSPDGVTWTVQASGMGNSLYGVTNRDGLFVAVGDRGTILTSPDRVTWMRQTSGTMEYLYGVTYGDGLFVAVGERGTILTSSDGVNWTAQTSGTSGLLYGVTYGDGLFVAVGGGGTILTSPDGVTWTRRTSGTSDWLRGVTYGDGLFVAVGERGTILTSPDRVTWMRQTSGTMEYLYGVTYGDGLFVAVGERGTILTSSDGVNWTAQTSGTSGLLYGVAYGNGLFVAVGLGGIILTSSDGVNWTAQTSGTSAGLRGVTYGDGTFVAVGDGIILTSP
jgi:phage terminase large subunit-like protein